MEKNTEKKKKCVTCWIDKEIVEQFNQKYFIKSLFIRECVKRAINDEKFYAEIITGGKK